MSEEQATPEEVPEPSKKTGRFFVSLIVLLLIGLTAAAAYLRESDFLQNLIAKDEWASRLIANLHPVFMLIPIGIALMVVLIEIFGWLSFGKWKPVTVFALFLTVMISILACLSGLVLMQLEGISGSDWTQYMWYGIGATSALALAFIFKIWGKNRNGRGFLYAIFLLGGISLLGYGGYTYGQKVHGYNLVPSRDEVKSPFMQKNEMERMTTEITELEAAAATMTTDLSTKDQKIAEVTAVQSQVHAALVAEQNKLKASSKQVAELQGKVAAGEKLLQESKTLAEQLKQELENLKKQQTELQQKAAAAEAAQQKAVEVAQAAEAQQQAAQEAAQQKAAQEKAAKKAAKRAAEEAKADATAKQQATEKAALLKAAQDLKAKQEAEMLKQVKEKAQQKVEEVEEAVKDAVE